MHQVGFIFFILLDYHVALCDASRYRPASLILLLLLVWNGTSLHMRTLRGILLSHGWLHQQRTLPFLHFRELLLEMRELGNEYALYFLSLAL